MSYGPQFLTQAELAQRWRISERTLERWRARRRGPTWLMLGGSVRYREEDVLAFEQRVSRGGAG